MLLFRLTLLIMQTSTAVVPKHSLLQQDGTLCSFSQICCHSLMRICNKFDLQMIGLLLRSQQGSLVILYFIWKDVSTAGVPLKDWSIEMHFVPFLQKFVIFLGFLPFKNKANNIFFQFLLHPASAVVCFNPLIVEISGKQIQTCWASKSKFAAGKNGDQSHSLSQKLYLILH